ncbi:hypothetical protein [Burkholderia cepacia]|uniref:hypothetical protein n=1 Tax=Burkholderia cepacia TaxID=292 RepID=UPI000AC5783C|nr:hypothetical protein [Burkholderia cepacia]
MSGPMNIFGSNDTAMSSAENSVTDNNSTIANLLAQQSDQQVADTKMSMKAQLGSALKGMIDKIQL